MFEAGNVGRVQLRLRHQLFEQQACAGAPGAVDEACPQARHVRHVAQTQRVAGRHHQALGAAREADDLVRARLEQGAVGARAQAGRVGERLGVKTGQQAAPLVERADRVHAAAEADVQVQPRTGAGALGVHAGGQVLQFGERVVVAGVEREHFAAAGRRFERPGKRALQLGAQVFHLRPQARLRQPLGHQQALPERAEHGGLAPFPDDEFLA
ncbi:hypothetical protein D9M69_492050 [compost metagenome]